MIHTIKRRPEIFFRPSFFIIISFLFFRPRHFLIQVISGLALLETYSGKHQVRGATPYAVRDKPFPIRFETPQCLEQKDGIQGTLLYQYRSNLSVVRIRERRTTQQTALYSHRLLHSLKQEHPALIIRSVRRIYALIHQHRTRQNLAGEPA